MTILKAPFVCAHIHKVEIKNNDDDKKKKVAL